MQHERDAEQRQIAQYFSEVSEKPLLSREQEIVLAKQKDAGIKARRQLVSGRFFTREQGLKRAERIETGDAAVQALTEGNLRYVIAMAKQYRGRGLPFADVIQEGNLGLMKAVDKFDGQKGFTFATYATFWIRQSITRALYEQTGTMYVPEYLQRQVQKVETAQERKLVEAGQESSLTEIAVETGLPVAKVEELRALSRRTVTSLDAPVDAQRARTSLQDALPAHNPAVEEVVYTHEEHRLIMEELTALKHVDKRTQAIVTQRYGLDGEEEKTLAEVGISYGLSRERVRQIERQALHRLQGNPTLRALAAEELRTPADTLAPRTNHAVTRRTPEQAEKQRQAQRDYKKRFNEKRRQHRAVGAPSEHEGVSESLHMQVLGGRFLALAGTDVVSDSQPVDM